MNICIFASGSGSNAENIIKYFSGNEKIKIDSIISNKADAYVHERAKKLGIESFTFSKNEFFDGTRIIEHLKNRKVEFIVLAGFLLKIPAILIENYPDKIINIHPALLPKFAGQGMYGDRVHKAVAEAKESETGITIHYVNENYDEGNIIFQAKCKVMPTENYEAIAQKVHDLEYKFFPSVIEQIINNAERVEG